MKKNKKSRYNTEEYFSEFEWEAKEKFLKKLRKKNAKGKLQSVNEKRLLEHLENWHSTMNQSFPDRVRFEKLYKKCKIISKILSVVFVAACVYVIYMVAHALIFAGAATFKPQWEIFGIITALPIDKMIGGFFASFMAYIVFGPLLSKKLLQAIMPKEYKNKSITRYEKTKMDMFDRDSPLQKCIAIILIALCAVVFVYDISISDIGYYDDYVKFGKIKSFAISTITYDELEIYKVKGRSKSGEFILYENAYAIRGGDEYYDYGEILPNGEMQQKLEEIAQKYNKEIKEINSIEDLYENSGN